MTISQDEFNKLRKFAASGLYSIADELEILALQDAAQEMRDYAKDTEEGTFKIIVMGDFSAGKSTLLNVLIGKSVLPTDMNPTTAVITRLKYGSTPQVVIKDVDERVPERITSLDAFKEETKLNAVDSKSVDTDRFNSIKEAVVSYPLEILRHNVEIIDSPGLNDSPVRTKRTLDMLPGMDAVIFLMVAPRFFSENEKAYLENYLYPQGLKNIFFIINQWDLIEAMSENPEKQRRDIWQLASDKLTQFCMVDGVNVFSQRVFPVSSLMALKGRSSGDVEQLDKSGFPVFENAMNRFLIEDRGSVIFKRLIERLKIIQKDRVQTVIENSLATLGVSVAELEERQQKLAPNLLRLEAINTLITERISEKSKLAQQSFFDSYLEKMRQIQNEVLPAEVENFDFSGVAFLDRFKSSGKQQIQVIFEKEAAKVIQRENTAWQQSVQGDMRKIMEELMEDIDDYSVEYQREVDTIMANFRGESVVMTKSDNIKPNWVATALGILLVDPATAMGGYNSGWAGAAANLGLSIGVGFLTSWILGPVGPIAWLGYQAWKVFEITKPEKLAQQLATSIKSERMLEVKVREDELKIKMNVAELFDDMIYAVESAISSDVKDLRASMEEIIQQKQREERSMEEETRRLEGIQDRCAKIISTLEQKLLRVEGVA